MLRRQRRFTPGYTLVLAGSFLAAVAVGWTTLATRMDRDAYDWMSRAHPPREHTPGSVVLAFDEQTLGSTGGMRNIRPTLASAITRILPSKPAVVAVDISMFEATDPAEDAQLAGVFRNTPNLVLASDLIPESHVWENPLPQFRASAKATGHAHAAPDPVSRLLPLELVSGHDRRWAMALEAARLKLGADIIESPDDLKIGSIDLPAARNTERALYIRYREGIPIVSVAKVLKGETTPEQFRGKAVFVGVTAQSAARDRLMTPLDRAMSGVEIHAQAFETIVNGEFLRIARFSDLFLICFALSLTSALIFAYLTGWRAYLAGAGVLVLAHSVPHIAFSNGVVLPYIATIWAAWLSVVSAAGWQYFVVRRQLQRSESDRQRYQQAIQFVTHEMRSPLTAIQGSSELMGRYNLTDEKRKQMAQMIHSESKRLAKMIQTFLDIERLSDGTAEIRSEPFNLDEVIETCMDRARALADRKQISLTRGETEAFTLNGDRELMEYAVYNLLTNAIKYSPPETLVTIEAQPEASGVRLTVRDQGMGMDEKELRKIGTRFYRTKRAEASGEVGTGIGLSLVQQIVAHHRGRMEVTSTPGAGSCFTMVLPAVPGN
ncbi:MAG: CHASE2 domain-containing protein [Bryobacteraceae bacterium]|nr:CHASE2 domain-containing protein [Bryobacteraceae bacterium]